MKIENLAEEAEEFTGNVWKIESSGLVALIDVGTGDSWDEIKKLDRIDQIVITHSHYDHIDNLTKIEEEYDVEIYAFEPENIPVKARRIKENELLEIASQPFKAIHTPGHKDDSVCLYNASDRILFTGDLIFPEGGFGRTDLEEGNRDLLIESISKIAELDVELYYPGHDDVVEEDANDKIQSSLENAMKRESKY